MTNYISPVDRLIEDLTSGLRSVEDLDEDEVVEIRQALNPYGTAINLENNTGKYFAYSFINLREEYLKKFLMTSLIGYLFKRCDEWGVPDGDYVVPIEEFNREQITREFTEAEYEQHAISRANVEAEMETREAEAQAKAEAKASALAKLEALGLTEEEASALIS